MVRSIWDEAKSKYERRRIIENKITCDVPGCCELVTLYKVPIPILNVENTNCKVSSMVVTHLQIASTHTTKNIIVKAVVTVLTRTHQDLNCLILKMKRI